MNKHQSYILIFLLFIGFISKAQSEFNEIDKRVADIGFFPKDKLAEKITSELNTDLEKVRALFVWITDNITYDFELYESEKLKEEFYISEVNVINKTLERKKAICSGYSLLFKKLCDDLDIECEVVSGYSKQWLDSFVSKNVSDHAWNAVKIDNKWFLIDNTWASKNENNVERDDFWFMTNPEFFVYSHYPENEKWTLLENGLTKEQFDQLPTITDRSFFEDGIKILVPTTKVIDVEKSRIIRVELETNNTERWISLRGYPWETYASKNNLEFPSDEEYAKLTSEERNKYNQVIPSVEIIKTEIVDNRIMIEARLTSENIKEFEIVVEGNNIATIKVNLK
ncbi:transglutaminase domain-containing protein [Mariniflexile litorale]|uniref:Transglutaminase domain-containing protein n=1 Tax=Mariniflexile litorale TaxID=3045158 RepID=A0AAU7EHG0_9FLAO|nr:transglutaminase domain-containing protein [Mariniflexile sp. KMM 9835]MDQ8213597.1 transglutaminase domain-containing protein [Mariniflexile sp. KMM 9835]